MSSFRWLILGLVAAPAFGSGIYNPGTTGGGGGSGGYALQPATVTIVAAQGVTLPDNTTVSTGAINLSQFQNTAAQNALQNGNFDAWTTGISFTSPTNGTTLANSWQMDPNSALSGTWFVTRVSTVTQGAQYALQWKTNGTPNPGIESIIQSVPNYYAYLGSSVTFTIWVNSTIGTTIGIRDSIGTSTSTAHPADSAWHQLSVTRFISTSATSLSVVLANNTLNGTNNTVYYDGAMLVMGDTPVNYGPSPWQIIASSQIVNTGTFSTTSNTYQSTTLTGTITPPSNSRIKITISGTERINAATGVNGFASLFRGSTNLAVGGNSAFFVIQSAAAQTTKSSLGLSFIDSPPTGSAVTYTVKIRNDDNATSVGLGFDSDLIMILEVVP